MGSSYDIDTRQLQNSDDLDAVNGDQSDVSVDDSEKPTNRPRRELNRRTSNRIASLEQSVSEISDATSQENAESSAVNSSTSNETYVYRNVTYSHSGNPQSYPHCTPRKIGTMHVRQLQYIFTYKC